MIALLLAAVVSSAAADRQILSQTPRSLADPNACREVAEKVREGQREMFRKLGELPPAHGEYAVMRKIDGCVVPAPMRYRPGLLKIEPPPQD